MTKLLSFDEAQRLTAPFHGAWTESYGRALELLNDGRKAIPKLFAPLEPVEYCDIVHRHVYPLAATKLQGDSRVVSTERLGFYAQIIEGRALVRFKHLNEKMYPLPSRTDQQDDLSRHEFTDDAMHQLAFDGVQKPPTVLTCGYQVSPAWDKLERVIMVCWYKSNLLYWYDLHNEAGELGQEIVRLPSIPPVAPKVVSRKAKEKPAVDEQVPE